MHHKTLNRRGFISTASGLALAPALGALTGTAHAADGDLVVGTWGGDYQNLLQQIIDPIVAKGGGKTVYNTGDQVSRLTKLRAEKDSRRGSMDVALLGEIDMYDAERQGTLEPLNIAKLPSLAHAIPALKTAYSIPHIFSAMSLVYSTEKFTTPPDSLAVLLDPKWKGQVGFSDILFMYNSVFVGLGAGGDTKSFEGGKRFLTKLKANAPRIYPSNEAVASAFKSGEIAIACMWKARALQWQHSGLPLAFAIPKEGSIPVSFEAGVAKNSRNKDAAWDYLNAMLDPQGQIGFAAKMGYAPTVDNAVLPDNLKGVGFSDAEIKRLKGYDLKDLTAGKSDILEFWNKDFKAG